MSKGLVYLTEDRKADGLFLRLPVSQNLVAALTARHATLGVCRPDKDSAVAHRLFTALHIVAPSLEADTGTLSGGNQQKVLLAKWLATKPHVLLLDEPTRGVDVTAKRQIHEAIMTLTGQGTAVLLISSDLPELVGMSDRVLVMRQGRLIGEMEREELSEEAVLLAANGHYAFRAPDAAASNAGRGAVRTTASGQEGEHS